MGCEEAACSEGADALVEHEPDAVAVADGARSARERRVRHVHARGLTANRFHDERQDLVGSDPVDRLLQRGKACRGCRLRAGSPEGQGRRHFLRVHGHGAPQRRSPNIAVEPQGLESRAVVAGHHRDHALTLSLSGRDGMGAQEFQRHLDGFGATGCEVHPLESGAAKRSYPFGECCVGGVSGRSRVRVGQLPSLFHHGLEDTLVSLSKCCEERARTDIEKAPAAIVDEVDALPCDDRRQSACRRPVEEHVLGPAHLWIAPVVHRTTP